MSLFSTLCRVHKEQFMTYLNTHDEDYIFFFYSYYRLPDPDTGSRGRHTSHPVDGSVWKSQV